MPTTKEYEIALGGERMEYMREFKHMGSDLQAWIGRSEKKQNMVDKIGSITRSTVSMKVKMRLRNKINERQGQGQGTAIKKRKSGYEFSKNNCTVYVMKKEIQEEPSYILALALSGSSGNILEPII